MYPSMPMLLALSLRWRFFQGKDCATAENAGLCGGLVKRRDAEYRQCIGETAP